MLDEFNLNIRVWYTYRPIDINDIVYLRIDRNAYTSIMCALRFTKHNFPSINFCTSLDLKKKIKKNINFMFQTELL